MRSKQRSVQPLLCQADGTSNVHGIQQGLFHCSQTVQEMNGSRHFYACFVCVCVLEEHVTALASQQDKHASEL